MSTNVSSTAITPNPKASSRAPSPAKPKRAPLLPSDADNNAPPLPRRPKSRDVSSRYMSSTASLTSSSSSLSSTATTFSSLSSTTTTSSSNSMCTPRRRFPSPLVSSRNLMTRAETMNSSKRAQSTERRRSMTPRIGEMSVTVKMLTPVPARRLSGSFQSQSFAISVSKASKSQGSGFSTGSRQCTPERRAVTPVNKAGNPKPINQHRWPGRSPQESFMTRSVDFTNENVKLNTNKPEANRSVNKLFSDSDNSDCAISDADSVSSGSQLINIRSATPAALMVPARFREQTANRLRRLRPEPVSPPLSRNNKLPLVNRFLKDGPALSPRGSSVSPARRGFRPASPSKIVPLSSPSGGMPSPTRARSGIGSSSNSNVSNTPSILSFAAETRRRKVGDKAIDDAYAMRLLHNKYLQWRFANARVDVAMLVQRATAQKSLYYSWVTTSKIRQSVISKQIQLQQLGQNLKLYTVLKNQISFLNVWDQVERDHIVSLSQTIVSLESSTLCLPLVDGAKANVQSLKDAIRLAADVTHAMTSLIHSLITKAEHVNILASGLANTTRKGRSMIDRCKYLLSILTHMEVQDCSLRTHILQLQNLPPTTITQL